MDTLVSQSPVLIVIIPLVAAFFTTGFGLLDKRVCYPPVITALSCAFAASLVTLTRVMKEGPIRYAIGNWPPPIGIQYVVDHLGAFVIVIVSAMSLFTAVYARKTVEKELPGKAAAFYTMFLLLVTGLMGIILTGDLFNLYVLLEIASLSAYALIAGGQERATIASFRYLIMGTVGACFYLIGIGYLYIVSGSLNMEDLRVLLPALYANRAVQASFVFILIGFGIKIALFPLHTWQPDAYTYAPSPVSIIISTAMAKTSLYALIRIIFSVFTVDFLTNFLPLLDVICWISAAAMIIGSLYAIAQFDLKRMLAYSSVANVGYIMLGVGLSTSSTLGLKPALMHLLNHAVMKGCMFMAACAFIYNAGLRDIRDFTGLGRRMPYTSLTFILSALAMIGMPPSVGFITKWYLILAALQAEKYAFVAVILFSTLLMIVYFWRVVEIMFIRTGEGPEQAGAMDETPMSMLLPGLILGCLCFALGIIWISGMLSPILDAVNRTFGLGVTA